MLSNFPTWSIRKPENTRPDAVCKVGGAPIGWPRDWPVCALCSLPMSFLGQFTGDPLAPRLASGQTLFLFTCEHDSGCDFWDPVNGANACVLAPHDELGANPTPIPEETPVLLELWVSSWTSRDDALPAKPGDSPQPTPEEDLFTKAGGTPYWTDNGPGYRIDPSDQMVLQIDTWVTVSDGQEALEAQAARFPDRAYTIKTELPSRTSCSDGIAFVMTHEGEPEVYLMVNR